MLMEVKFYTTITYLLSFFFYSDHFLRYLKKSLNIIKKNYNG